MQHLTSQQQLDCRQAGRKTGLRTTAIIVPNTQDLMHEVTMSQDVIAPQAESRMTLAETPYTVSARPTLAANPAKHTPHVRRHDRFFQKKIEYFYCVGMHT